MIKNLLSAQLQLIKYYQLFKIIISLIIYQIVN